MALFPASSGGKDEIITVLYSNKNSATLASGNTQTFTGTGLNVTLPTGVSDLSDYALLGISDMGYISSERICFICANATTPYITVSNETGGTITIGANYVQMKARYMKKK